MNIESKQSSKRQSGWINDIVSDRKRVRETLFVSKLARKRLDLESDTFFQKYGLKRNRAFLVSHSVRRNNALSEITGNLHLLGEIGKLAGPEAFKPVSKTALAGVIRYAEEGEISFQWDDEGKKALARYIMSLPVLVEGVGENATESLITRKVSIFMRDVDFQENETLQCLNPLPDEFKAVIKVTDIADLEGATDADLEFLFNNRRKLRAIEVPVSVSQANAEDVRGILERFDSRLNADKSKDQIKINLKLSFVSLDDFVPLNWEDFGNVKVISVTYSGAQRELADQQKLDEFSKILNAYGGLYQLDFNNLNFSRRPQDGYVDFNLSLPYRAKRLVLGRSWSGVNLSSFSGLKSLSVQSIEYASRLVLPGGVERLELEASMGRFAFGSSSRCKYVKLGKIKLQSGKLRIPNTVLRLEIKSISFSWGTTGYLSNDPELFLFQEGSECEVIKIGSQGKDNFFCIPPSVKTCEVEVAEGGIDLSKAKSLKQLIVAGYIISGKELEDLKLDCRPTSPDSPGRAVRLSSLFP